MGEMIDWVRAYRLSEEANKGGVVVQICCRPSVMVIKWMRYSVNNSRKSPHCKL